MIELHYPGRELVHPEDYSIHLFPNNDGFDHMDPNNSELCPCGPRILKPALGNRNLITFIHKNMANKMRKKAIKNKRLNILLA